MIFQGLAAAAEGEPPAKKARFARFYRIKEKSDAVLSIGDGDFHVHSQFLSARSTYFQELFDAHPSADGGKISIKIDEDEVGFAYLMNLLYKHTYTDEDKSVQCTGQAVTQFSNKESLKKGVVDKWKWFSGDMRIAEKFKVVDIVRPTLERQALLWNCGRDDCPGCASVSLIALHYNWNHIISRMKTSPDTLVAVLTFLSSEPTVDLPTFHIAPQAFFKILDGLVGGKPKKLDLATKGEDEKDEDTPRVFNYGQPDCAPSDVTLVVKNCEFEVHKQFLATRSPFFNALFFAEFKEKKTDKVPIEAGDAAFKGVMDLLYHGRIDDDVELFTCKGDLNESQIQITRFWTRLPVIAELFDRFDLPLRLLEDALLSRCQNDVGCLGCASKRLLAIHYDMKKVKEKIPSDPGAIALCLRSFQHVLPTQLHLTPAEFCDLIKATKEKFPANA